MLHHFVGRERELFDTYVMPQERDTSKRREGHDGNVLVSLISRWGKRKEENHNKHNTKYHRRRREKREHNLFRFFIKCLQRLFCF